MSARQFTAFKRQTQPAKPPASRPTRGRMNQTEAEYRGRFLDPQVREGSLVGVEFEAVRLRLGTGVTYTADFASFDPAGRLVLHEVKGAHVWEDARVKFRCAVQQYPAIRFVWAQKKKDGWQVEEFN